MSDETTGTGWAQRIKILKTEQQQLRSQRQKVTKDLKAAQRKNKRLKERARFLSEDDMVQILVMKRTKDAGNETAAVVASTGGASSSGLNPVSNPDTRIGEGVQRDCNAKDIGVSLDGEHE